MRMPKTVPVLGQAFKVVVVKELKDEDGNRVDGLFCSKTSTISIDQDDKNKLHTLLHEMGHAMFERSSLNQTDISTNLQEIIVNNMATILMENFEIKVRRKDA